MEDEERQKKLEAGKAKLAQFRQRKADGHNTPKKQKKKKKSSSTKEDELSKDGLDINLSEHGDICTQSSERGAAATNKSTVMRIIHSGDIIRHDQTFTIEPESEISTTADDNSSEEEEFGVPEREMQSSQTQLEVMEDELVGKQQEIEELNRELEEMRTAYGTEGLQQSLHTWVQDQLPINLTEPLHSFKPGVSVWIKECRKDTVGTALEGTLCCHLINPQLQLKLQNSNPGFITVE